MMENATAAAGAMWVMDWNSVGAKPTAFRSSRCRSTDVLMIPSSFRREHNISREPSQWLAGLAVGRGLGRLLVRQGRLGISPRDDPQQAAFASRHQAVGLDLVVPHRL